MEADLIFKEIADRSVESVALTPYRLRIVLALCRRLLHLVGEHLPRASDFMRGRRGGEGESFACCALAAAVLVARTFVTPSESFQVSVTGFQSLFLIII
jgi:hypothetical protein